MVDPEVLSTSAETCTLCLIRIPQVQGDSKNVSYQCLELPHLAPDGRLNGLKIHEESQKENT